MSLSWGENIISGLPFCLGRGTGHPGDVPKGKMRGKSLQRQTIPRPKAGKKRSAGCRISPVAAAAAWWGPYGHVISDTVWDREEIIYAQLDMQQAAASKMEHDVCGHYARPDVLSLQVREG